MAESVGAAYSAHETAYTLCGVIDVNRDCSDTMSSVKRRAITAAEQDVVEARRWYCYTQRAGVASGVKRQMRRRERREGKREAIAMSVDRR